jgi:exopolyphosphatase/guanosine-5'-triphosphate,3'-diphosphate pyrophosphatase
MRIAAIDLGSNSVHMVAAEVGSSGGIRVLDREAEMVRLGAGTLTTGVIPPEAVERTLGILRAFKRLAQIHKVEEIVAVATSAIREARNGEDVLNLIGRKIGIFPRAIPGEDEARLVYIAALHSVHLEGRPTLVVDIGGGSVEIVVGRGTAVTEAASLKLGVIRLAEEFAGTDPLSTRDEKRLVRRVEELLDPVVKRVARAGFERAVGTSGTILALGRLALAAATGSRPESLHHASVSLDALRQVRKKVTALDLRRRLKLPGMDRRRADLLPVGAVLLDTLLSRLGARELILCEWALREGLLLDFASRQRTALARAEAFPDVRRRSVLLLAERCQAEAVHARHVARLALDIFDASKTRHRLGDGDRAILEFAALLHDVGQHISHSQHHKHSYYLVKNGDLRGFDPVEIEVMANVARYHRGGQPSKKHAAFAALPREDRGRVVVLAGILRLAEALDRSHRQRVRAVEPVRGARGLRLRLRTAGDVELELWGARRNGDLLEAALGVPARIECAAERRAAPRRLARTA